MNPSVLHHVTCASVLTMLTACIVEADLVNDITQVLCTILTSVLQEMQGLLGSAFEILCDQRLNVLCSAVSNIPIGSSNVQELRFNGRVNPQPLPPRRRTSDILDRECTKMVTLSIHARAPKQLRYQRRASHI